MLPTKRMRDGLLAIVELMYREDNLWGTVMKTLMKLGKRYGLRSVVRRRSSHSEDVSRAQLVALFKSDLQRTSFHQEPLKPRANRTVTRLTQAYRLPSQTARIP